MSQLLTIDITPEEAAQLQTLMEECVQTVRAAEERMNKYESERKQMQAETGAMLQQLREALHVEDHP